jgi:hypothetical protein
VPDRGQQHLHDVTTSTLSGAEPAGCWDVRASDSTTRQNGQATAIWSAPVATASSVGSPLILVPSSSIHVRTPPAPQRNEIVPCCGFSVNVTPGSAPISAREGRRRRCAG